MKEKTFSPVVVFAFNRPDSLRNTITTLAANAEASSTDLYVFVDGPRESKEGEATKVEAVRSYVATITGFRSVAHSFSETNKGLAPSIIAGVTKVLSRHPSAIIVEDDLVVASNFLAFMNAGLERYANQPAVFSVCGYTNRVTIPEDYKYDAYFCVRSSSWGWATWADRWASVDWQLKDWERHKRNALAFCRWGGSDCWKMLDDWHRGRNKSWAIRFCYAQYVQNKLSLFPTRSKVNNEGFDGKGTNCKKWSRFKCDIDTSGNKTYRLPENIEMNRHLYRSAKHYHSLPLRLYSKLMYIIYK